MRRSSFFFAACFGCALGSASQAKGSQGRLGFEPWLNVELSMLHHPDAGYSNSRGAFTYLSRLGSRISYGMLNNWDLFFSVGGSFESTVVARGVAFQNFPRGDVYAIYHDVTAMMGITYHMRASGDFSFISSVGGGYIFSHWYDKKMLELGHSNFIRTNSRWHTTALARIGIGAEWRPIDWLTASISPYAAIDGSKNLYVGLDIASTFSFGIGGIWDPL